MSERRFILTWAAILAGLIACAWLLMRTSYGQTTAPTTATALFNDATGDVQSIAVQSPPRRTPVRPPVTQPTPPPNTITLSVASLVFNQSTKAPQSVTATGPAGVQIASHDNLSFVDTGGPTGTGSVTATFTPNATYSAATANIIGSASFTAGTLTAILPVSLKVGTVTPPPQTGLGSTEPAIADWDIIPFMAVSGMWRPGVVAFHVNTAGIAKVDYKVDGAAAGTATAMALNPDSNVNEYFVPIDTATLAAGNHQLSATVTPNVGKPKTLQSYQFSVGLPTRTVTATGGNTASACQAVKAQFGFGDGVTVLLSSGNWTLDAGGLDTKVTHVIFAAASGASVTINGWNGASPHHIKVVGCKMSVGVPNISASDPRFLWIDHCTLDHGDPLSDTTGFTGWTDARSGGTPGQPWTSGDGMVQTACVTDSTITNSANGWLNGLLARNCTITKLGSDAISNNQTSINCTISSLGVPNSGMHPDVGQWNNHKTGVIIYGLTGAALDMAQGISPEDTGAFDWAIVNVSLQSNGVGNMLGLGTTLANFLVKNAVLNAPSQVRAASGWTGADVVFEHVVDGSGNPVGGVPADVTVR
jgi:hypothetical protein